MTDNERKELLSKAKPILFNTEMVRAILDGRKTVTRRVLKKQPWEECNDKGSDHEFVKDSDIVEGDLFTGFVCRKCGCGVSYPHDKYPVGTSYIRPLYKDDDILYIRETWCGSACKYYYRADNEEIEAPVLVGSTVPFGKADGLTWKPSIHMPKEAARIFLRVTDVRIERLQGMTDEDIVRDFDLSEDAIRAVGRDCIVKEVWNRTIKKSDLDKYGWAANPFVWVIEFDVYKINQPPFGG